MSCIENGMKLGGNTVFIVSLSLLFWIKFVMGFYQFFGSINPVFSYTTCLYAEFIPHIEYHVQNILMCARKERLNEEWFFSRVSFSFQWLKLLLSCKTCDNSSFLFICIISDPSVQGFHYLQLRATTTVIDTTSVQGFLCASDQEMIRYRIFHRDRFTYPSSIRTKEKIKMGVLLFILCLYLHLQTSHCAQIIG